MSISAKELAEKLNVSAATVSMVLNNKPGISNDTRERVLSAANEYGFDFSKLGAKTGTAGSIQLVIYKKHGLVVADTPFFAQVIESIEQECRHEDMSLQITYFYSTGDPDEQMEVIKRSNCDGILLLGTEMQLEDLEHFVSLNSQLVVLDTYFDELDLDFVTINNFRGMVMAADYLFSKGFSEIGYLRSSYDIVNFSERADGYCRSLKKHGAEYKTELIHRLTPSAEGAYKDMKKLLETGCPVASAYVADNDLIAAGAIKAFKEHGLNIPEDVSVIGFDNMPVCNLLEPPLTTVDVPKKAFGSLGFKQLTNKIQRNSNGYLRTMLSPAMRIRKSVIKKPMTKKYLGGKSAWQK